MGKVLFVSNITEHIDSFHIPYMEWFQRKGWEVHVAANGPSPIGNCDCFIKSCMERSPVHLFKNLKAILELKRVIEKEKYDIVYCHTPMGGVVGRLASKKAHKNGTRVIYMVHGFHFYKNAPILNWLIYFPVEKVLAYYTDCIITINEEDYKLAQKRFKSLKTQIYHVNGVGVSFDRFSVPTEIEKLELHDKYGYAGKIVFLYAAEFITRKNHIFIINTVNEVAKRCPDVIFLFAGRGPLFEQMKKAVELRHASALIDFLGFRNDIPMLLKMCDVLISPSFQEGLAVNIIEGLASGLPILCSNVRGNREMVEDGENGYLFSFEHVDEYVERVIEMCNDTLRIKMGHRSYEIAKQFSLDNSLRDISGIITKYM